MADKFGLRFEPRVRSGFEPEEDEDFNEAVDALAETCRRVKEMSNAPPAEIAGAKEATSRVDRDVSRGGGITPADRDVCRSVGVNAVDRDVGPRGPSYESVAPRMVDVPHATAPVSEVQFVQQKVTLERSEDLSHLKEFIAFLAYRVNNWVMAERPTNFEHFLQEVAAILYSINEVVALFVDKYGPLAKASG